VTTPRKDPVLTSNFRISLLPASSSTARTVTAVTLGTVMNRPAAGFSECSGLEMTLDVHDVPEGGNNGTVLKFPTRVKHGTITLKRGVTSNTELWDWFYGFVLGQGRRRDGVIVLQDARHRAHTTWAFRRGLPLKYAGPQLHAGQSHVAVESIEIAHEGLSQMPGASALSRAVSEAAGAVAGLFR
jgi:phage tail-like protein